MYSSSPVCPKLCSLSSARVAGGAGGPMMTIGNVEERHLAKRVDKAHGIGHMPDGVLNSVVRGEVENGISHRRLHHHRVDIAAGPVGQKHRSGLRAQHQHVLGAIVFLVAARAFVFANQVLVILIYRATSDYANLFVFSHDHADTDRDWESVSVTSGQSLMSLFEVLHSLGDRRRSLCVSVPSGHINFRPGYVQETQRIVGRQERAPLQC